MTASANRAGPSAPTPGFLTRYQAPVQRALRQRLADCPAPIGAMLRYHMGWATPDGAAAEFPAGKGLRPAICLFTCEAVGGDVDDALPAAAALELLHNFSLIHDDIQDQDEERHGRSTVWAVWGKPRGVVAGNALRTYADATLYALRQAGASSAASLDVVQAMTGQCLGLVEGQCMDLSFEARTDVTPDEYLDMVSRKTGGLVDAAMYMGAVLGGATAEQADRLAHCGRLLGLAFQARDDVLGIWGNPAVMGKPTGADIRRRKKSLPVLYGFTNANAAQRARLEAIYAGDAAMPDVAVAEVMAVLADVGAQGYAQSVAEEKGALAVEAARGAGLPAEALAALEDLAHFFTQRDH